MKLTKAQRLALSSSLSVFLVGCGSPNYSPSEMHMTLEEVESSQPTNREDIPALVKATPTMPILSNERGSDTFDIVVTNVPVRDLLFALARDAGVNMDVDADVGGLITMSAIDQTLDAILERIALQIPIRVARVGNAIVVKNDEHYYKKYKIDYLSLSRTFESEAGAGGVGDASADITNEGENNFWGNFEESIGSILGVDVVQADGKAAIADSLIREKEKGEALEAVVDSSQRYESGNSYDFNIDTGLLIVYAPDRLQKEIQSYIDTTMSIVKRQVLLEATIVEVILSDEYKQGINWSAFSSLSRNGLSLYQGAAGGAAAALKRVVEEFTQTNTQTFGANDTAAMNNFIAGQGLENANSKIKDLTTKQTKNADGTTTVERTYTVARTNQEATKRLGGGLSPTNSSVTDPAFTAAFRSGDISAAVELLDKFGNAKVLSSPRISVLNNQAGILRVVDQEVYFSIDVNDELNEDTGQISSRSFEVTENTVDVGFAMNVLPHITESGEIYLNLKPSVTRVLSYRKAPTPAPQGTAQNSSENYVPVTRVREIESVMILQDGEIAVMGGLLEDRTGDSNKAVPGLASLPGVGNLFQNKSESTYKTEFVVFIKAKIIKNPSIYGDYSNYRKLLPNSDFIIRDQKNNILPPKQKNAR